MSGSTIAPLPSGDVTMLFTDIEGSTSLVDALGAAYADLLAQHRRVLREVWDAHRGVEVGTEGDSFFIAFADAPDAVRATIAGQRALRGQEWPGGVQVRVRMGLHTGRPALLDGERDYWGPDVHLAARVGAAAHGGQVLLTGRTAQCCTDAATEDLGKWRLKGFEEPEQLFHLVIDGADADAFPPPRAMDVRPSNLPHATTPLIGRDSAVAQVCHLLKGSNRLVTVVGIGGVGKTRFALAVGDEVLEHFRDGVFFADLSGVSDPGTVPEVVAAAVGADAGPGGPLVAAVRELLVDRHLLLIVDNCEHVLDGVAAIGNWLEAAPRLRVLATSQVPLRLRGEHLVALGSLDLPGDDAVDQESLAGSSAVRLFVDRVQLIEPGFELTRDNAAAVVEICRRLDGSPMAIELAASRYRLLGVEQLAHRLAESLLTLGGGHRDAPARQRSLEAAMAWATDLLSDDERVAFRRWGVFAGRPSLDRAEAVVSEEIDPLSAIAGLVDHSLVRRDQDGRLRMPQSVLAYAQHMLAQSGEVEAVRRRHADVMAATAERHHDTFMHETEAVLDDAAAERDDLFAALRWAASADELLHARLAANMTLPLLISGSALVLEPHIEAALGAVSDASRTRERLLTADGVIAYVRGDRTRERERFEAAIGLADDLGDDRERALIRVLFAKVVTSGDQPEVDPVRLTHEALEIARAAGIPGYERLAMYLDAEAHLAAGRTDDAVRLLEVLSLDPDAGDFAAMSVPDYLPDLAYAAGRYQKALEQAVTRLRTASSGGSLNISWAAFDVGVFLIAVGDMERGVRLLGAVDVYSKRAGVYGRPSYLDERIRAHTGEAVSTLGAGRYEEILESGRRLDWDVALGLALRAGLTSGAR